MNTDSATRELGPHFEDLQPFGPADEECINEIREVLRRHDKLNRFGLSLLHEHFEMSDDEVLKEIYDPQTQTMTITAVKEASLEGQPTITTLINVGTGRPIQKCSYGKCE